MAVYLASLSTEGMETVALVDFLEAAGYKQFVYFEANGDRVFTIGRESFPFVADKVTYSFRTIPPLDASAIEQAKQRKIDIYKVEKL